MPLRVRLSIAFVAIVLVPLTVAALLVRGGISGELDKRTRAPLSNSNKTVETLLSQYRLRAAAAAADFSAKPGVGDAARDGKRVDLQRLTTEFAAQDFRADFVIVTDATGQMFAGASGRTPKFAAGATVPAIADVARGAVTGRRETVDEMTVRAAQSLTVSGRVRAWVVAGFWLDQDTLAEVSESQPGIDLTFFDGRVVTATQLDPAVAQTLVDAPAGNEGAKIGDLLAIRSRPFGSGPVLVASASRLQTKQAQSSTIGALLTVVAISVLMAALLGWLLARVTTRPLAELSEAALNVAGGRLDTKIEVRSRDEVGKLALAFNTMTDELRTYINALQDSRDELKRNLTRLGDTLSSTHDLKKMLAVILETAMVTIRAEAGALMLFSSNREELYLKVGRGLDGRLPSASVRVPVGSGVAGRVAQTGEAIHGQTGDPGQLRLAESEPRADSVISVPLKSQGRVIGVLNLYDRVDADAFDDSDLATIRSFANQATVAIDNVLLHQEAQRLSITDGLTGLWNYRFFQMRLDQEIERASRFERPLALLIFDLDKFKSVNDDFGHQRGDSVLIELATRVKGAIREVDTLARYGGEEFCLILPETDVEGAEQTAAKICELVRQRRFGAAGEVPIRITVSVGVAVYTEHGRNAGSLMKAADAALYTAKEGGRDQHRLALPAAEGDGPDVPATTQRVVTDIDVDAPLDPDVVATALAGEGTDPDAMLAAMDDEVEGPAEAVGSPRATGDTDGDEAAATPDDAPVVAGVGASGVSRVGGSPSRYPQRAAAHRGRDQRKSSRRRGRG